MAKKENIEHDGIVERISDEHVHVRIVVLSACAACHAKSMCNMSEMEAKVIDVRKDPSHAYAVGEHVSVILEESLGYRALFLGYLLPFLVLMAVLILSTIITGNELISGLLALAVLVPYYIILLMNKEKLKRKFEFRIK